MTEADKSQDRTAYQAERFASLVWTALQERPLADRAVNRLLDTLGSPEFREFNLVDGFNWDRIRRVLEYEYATYAVFFGTTKLPRYYRKKQLLWTRADWKRISYFLEEAGFRLLDLMDWDSGAFGLYNPIEWVAVRLEDYKNAEARKLTLSLVVFANRIAEVLPQEYLGFNVLLSPDQELFDVSDEALVDAMKE